MRQHVLNHFSKSSEGERRQALIAFGIPARQGGVFVRPFVCLYLTGHNKKALRLPRRNFLAPDAINLGDGETPWAGAKISP